MFRSLLRLAVTGALASVTTLSAAPVISEIMFHSSAVPENVAQEWIELHNPDPVGKNVTGWKFTKGVAFTMPLGATIPANGYLVVAANLATFQALHPAVTNVVGGWTGQLSNSGETIRLEDTAGVQVDSVTYANEGEWAVRARGPLSFGHKGWMWSAAADGGGKSLEIINPTLHKNSGQNWKASTTVGGTPGAVNSVFAANVAPLILDVKHRPEIPHSTDPIVVSASFADEGIVISPTLHWRLDAGSWQTLPMVDADSDGEPEAAIPPQVNLAIVEFYISVTDGSLTRTWPAPARTSDVGVLPETSGQVTNALVQVDNGFNAAEDFTLPAGQPLYRFLMTAAEKAELTQIGTTSGQEDSDAAMNTTFISQDGRGVEVHYLAETRNRGDSSRLGPPNNFYLGLRSDDTWQGRSSFQFNCQYPHSQVLGALLMQLAGLAAQEATPVRLRINGVDLAESGSRMYGRYARIEPANGAWAKVHFPNDPDGNLYRLDDHNPGSVGTPVGNLGSGEFRYEGTNPLAYSDTYFKKTNEEINDWTDLSELCKVLSAPLSGGTAEQPAIADSDYAAALAAKMDVNQWLTFFAADALMGNQEGGLQSGRGDDVAIYRGVVDQRFILVPHDFDAVFNLGIFAGDALTRPLFSYDFNYGTTTAGTGVLGLTRFFSHPDIVPLYYAKVLEEMDRWFNHAKLDPLLDRLIGGWVPAAAVTSIKGFIDTRRANVLGQIQQNYSLTTTVGGTDTAEGYKRTLDGSATFSGTFHVGNTRSILVNNVAANFFYRPSGSDAAGTWKLAVPGGGGTVLHPGLNHVTVQFWEGKNGTGNLLQTLSAEVLYAPLVPTYTNIAGTLSTGSLRLTAPASYIPTKPFLVRADVLDSAANLNRNVWDGTVTLTSSVGTIALPSIQLYNGTGSVLVTAGGGGGVAPTVFFSYGSGGTGVAGSGTAGSAWKSITDFTSTSLASFITTSGTTWKNEGFNDSTWVTRTTQTGFGDGDENTPFTNVDYDSAAVNTQSGPVYLFRNTFNIADINAVASVTGEVKYDDGAVVYVNGTQLLRTANLDPAGTLASYAIFNNAASTENATAALSIPLNLLHTGTNTIAVEVHQHDNGSSDVTFDLKLQANYPSSDPGNFTITGSYNGPAASFSNSRALTSLTTTPTITNVSGTLAVGTVNWSGVMQLTGDVTVPVGGTLNIAAGTTVLINGNATAGSSSGTRLIVNGTLNANGTAAQPINLTATNAGDRFGGIVFSSAQPSTLTYTLLSHAGHTTGVGHTSSGPVLRLTSSAVTVNDCVLADCPGKAVYTSGICSLTLQRSLIERMITGPEVEDGCTVSCVDTDVHRMLPDYRESNAPLADDEDCFYLHNDSGASVVMNRCVFAHCGDDVLDNLGGPLTVMNCILREGWDKGVSLLGNDLTISDTQIIHCDKSIALKSRNADTRTVTATNVTIIGENHDSLLAPWGYAGGVASGDPDTPSTGFYTQNKAGQSNTSAVLIFNAKNCILQAQVPILVDAPYSAANSMVNYSDLTLPDNSAFPWPGTGNLGVNPLFVAAASGDYHLLAASPCRDTGDPASPLNADGSRADMGALPYSGTVATPATVTWTTAGSPYHITGDTSVPLGTTLVINPGVSVQFDQNKKLSVAGVIKVLGTNGAHVVFSHIPGATATDPITGQAGKPVKWGGIVVTGPTTGPAITGNEFRYCDFIGAQPAVAAGNTGSLGIIRAEALIDHCNFLGTHLRQVYGENCSLQIQYSSFVDPFDPAVSGDNPVAYSLDNIAEPLKVANADFPANANYTDGLPNGGHFRVWYNHFYGNKGHNDVFDADAGVLGRSAILDCRYNYFYGLTGDEHIDLGGDAYVASNVFERGHKDVWTNDRGYSNCISSGDKGSGTSIWVVRNTAFDVDHMINCKVGTATLFEHNTIANLHADFSYTSTPPVAAFTQDVRCSAVNMFVPDDSAPQAGYGAYLGYNLFHNLPRIVTWADLPGGTTTKLQATKNYLNGITDNSVGPVTGTYAGGTQHPGGFTALGPYVTPGDPLFVDAVTKNYALKIGSPARATTPEGFDYGATIPEWAYVLDGPAALTDATNASFTIGGPGMVAYKWRLDGGGWSAPLVIGSGLAFPRTATPVVRQATLALSGLGVGAHTLEVVGQDPAGNWQDADSARTAAGLAQAAPTLRTWTVSATPLPLVLNEVLAENVAAHNNGGTFPDYIEIYNPGSTAVSLSGYMLTDNLTKLNKYVFGTGNINPGEYLLVYADAPATTPGRHANFSLKSSEGEAVYLSKNGIVLDSIVYGIQIPDYSIGRTGNPSSWSLNLPTPGAANVAARLGDPTNVSLNEWLASSNVHYQEDWIELRNVSPLPVLLSGLTITDNVADATVRYPFPPLSFIAPSGYTLLTADADVTKGADHLAFKLGSFTDEIALYLGTAQLQRVRLEPQTSDVSQGIAATGGVGGLDFYKLPTDTFANGTGNPAYANALAILNGLRITEIMYAHPLGTTLQYVELTNIGAVSLDLSGVHFTSGITFTFPVGYLLAPGAQCVVVSHAGVFTARYGSSIPVAGQFTGTLSATGENLALQLAPPYSAFVLNFDYQGDWYAAANGGGKALLLASNNTLIDHFDKRSSWTVSTDGGNPAGLTTQPPPQTSYVAWLNYYGAISADGDEDADGLTNLLEYACGTDVHVSSVQFYPVPTLPADHLLRFQFTLPQTSTPGGLGLPDIRYIVEAGNDLDGWVPLATKLPSSPGWTGPATVTASPPSNGRVALSLQDIVPVSSDARRFLRLRTQTEP